MVSDPRPKMAASTEGAAEPVFTVDPVQIGAPVPLQLVVQTWPTSTLACTVIVWPLPMLTVLEPLPELALFPELELELLPELLLPELELFPEFELELLPPELLLELPGVLPEFPGLLLPL